jgi:hypothetical protein
VWPVDSVALALANAAGGRHPHVLVLDARDVSDLHAALEAVQAQSPRTVVVAFAEDATKVQRAAALKGARVFAVLPTQIEPSPYCNLAHRRCDCARGHNHS